MTDRMLAVVIAALFVTGCTGDGLVTSTGTVTCDGQPIAEGAISFHPIEKSVAPQGSRIVAGRYEIRGKAGRQRVEIVASRSKENAPEMTPGMQPREMFIPSRYNVDSVLEADVTADGRNVFDFDLYTKPSNP